VVLEFTQIWFPGRTVSRNDIVAETLGGIIGVLLWLCVGRRTVGWLRAYFGNPSQPSQLEWLLQAYLVGFLIVSVLPLDLTISLTEVYHKYERGQVLLIPFAYHYESLSVAVYQLFSDTVLFVPVGALFALTARRRMFGRSPLLIGAVGGGVAAAAIEFTQLLVLSRYTNVTDVLLGTLGSGIGAYLVVLGDNRPVSRPGASRLRASLPWVTAIVVYSLFLIAGFWFPFEISHDRALVRSRLEDFLYRVPFQTLYEGTEFNATNQLLIRVLLYAPVGAMWAYVASLARAAPVRRTLALAGLVYAASLAFGIEAGQVFMPSKVADLTEVVLCTTGAMGGLYVTRRLLRPR
jgi:glycopeptide antibiotics resistance protein